MPPPDRPILDLTEHVTGVAPGRRIGDMAAGLLGSEILGIAAQIRGLVREGREITNFTVGDFDPRQFPIPAKLRSAIVAAYERGETNYPPSDGMPELREAVLRFYERELGLRHPLGSVLIAAGARPLIYATFRALVDPGDRVVYPVPSWNNNHYAHLVGATGVPLSCSAETRFLPTAELVTGALRGARLLCINSPLNPSGTAIDPAALRGIAAAVVAENRMRERNGERPVYLMYDQIYWMLRFGGTEHATPSALVPEVARWTIYVDGISKAFAATGVRVGWSVGPVDVIERMSAILGHVGAWAPRAEQLATAALLAEPEAVAAHAAAMRDAVAARLQRLHEGLQGMAAEGLPVTSLPPMGAIYLAARIAPFGRRTQNGARLQTNEEVRRYLLDQAGVAVVPFQAFGVRGDDGWFRLSVGAVSLAQIDSALPRIAKALRGLA
jgi:aspartate aminotransferase